MQPWWNHTHSFRVASATSGCTPCPSRRMTLKSKVKKPNGAKSYLTQHPMCQKGKIKAPLLRSAIQHAFLDTEIDLKRKSVQTPPDPMDGRYWCHRIPMEHSKSPKHIYPRCKGRATEVHPSRVPICKIVSIEREILPPGEGYLPVNKATCFNK